MKPLLFSAAAAFLLCGGPALAEPLQYSDTVFNRPDGWVLYRGGEGFRQLGRRYRESCDDCLMFVTASRPAPADLARLARDSARLFLSSDDPTPQISTEPLAGDFGAMKMAMGSWMVGDDLLFIVPVQQGDKATIIGFRGPAGTPEQITETSETFETSLMSMIDGLYFIPPGKPLMPPPEPGPFDGIYWGSVTRSTLGMDGMMQMDIQSRAVVFWKEGWFYDGTPENGMTPPTPAELVPWEHGDGDWGTYRIEGNQISVTYTSGGTESFRVAASGTSFYDGDRQMFQAEQVPDGLRFSGSQTWSSYSGFNPTIIVGGAASRSYVAYHSDGTYSGGGWSSVTATVQGQGIGADQTTLGGTAGFRQSAPDGGRYEVKGGVIHMIPDDGSAPYQKLIYRIGGGLMIGTRHVDQD
ncbi:MAG: hypothetical protein Q4G26_07520 [Paracoccus sp. (in: a-proteobacteria)]|nr:hypothetical protein [Paracoccus sp. (in: a-proteobacteria)]